MTNHLIQSTLFAGVIFLLTLGFRENAARVRYWLWMAASVKFLLPFSFLAGLGSRVQWRRAAPPAWSRVMENVSRSFAAPDVHFAGVGGSGSVDWSRIGGIIWLSGLAVVMVWWVARWIRVWASVQKGQAVRLRHRVVVEVPGLVEPGVFGIFRPVLLMPRGIAERLTREQLDAIVSHELCHIRLRDNLTSTIHMMVEALFWFHPLVWWIGARLLEERERACDEEVLRMGNSPEVYAESILKVCRLYLESPLPCVSGVTGADLKHRIEAIMTRGVGIELNFARKSFLGAVGLTAVLGPVLVGIWNAPPVFAQVPKKHLAFEVASVKPAAADSIANGVGLEFAPSGRMTARNVPLFGLVAMAFNVPFQGPRLTGMSAEMANGRYDIEATAEAGSIPAGASREVREAKMRLMLQTLLEDRFKLKMRIETKVLPVYAVVVGKNGPKMSKAKVEEKDCSEGPSDKQRVTCHEWRGGMGRGLHSPAATMADLAMAVSNWADRPVIDRTGLEGLFEIETEGWSPMVPRGPDANEAETTKLSDPTRPTLYMILDRLGLKMESSKAPIEMFVIEHIEKPPGN